MLNRSCPRFMTAMVTGKGKPSPSVPAIFPVTRNPSSGSSPRATVPGMRGRADMPSAKKSLGSSGSYLGWLGIFWRQAVSASISSSASTRRRDAAGPAGETPALRCAALRCVDLPRDIDNLPRMECLEELPDAVKVELRIAGLDDEEELVARGLIEAPHVEDGVIRHRQSVEGEHAEDGGERGDQDRALERDRNPGWPRVVRLAADV